MDINPSAPNYNGPPVPARAAPIPQEQGAVQQVARRQLIAPPAAAKVSPQLKRIQLYQGEQNSVTRTAMALSPAIKMRRKYERLARVISSGDLAKKLFFDKGYFQKTTNNNPYALVFITPFHYSEEIRHLMVDYYVQDHPEKIKDKNVAIFALAIPYGPTLYMDQKGELTEQKETELKYHAFFFNDNNQAQLLDYFRKAADQFLHVQGYRPEELEQLERIEDIVKDILPTVVAGIVTEFLDDLKV